MKWAIGILLALAIAVGVCVCQLLIEARDTVREFAGVPARLQSEAIETREGTFAEIDITRKELLKRVDQIALKLDTQLSDTRRDVMAEVATIRQTASIRTGETLSRFDTALSEIHEIHGDLKPILGHAASVAKQVDEVAPMYLNCEFNANCVFNRYVGLSKGAEKAAENFGVMSTEIKAALPDALLTWQRIGGNVDATTANVARITKPRWFDNVAKGAGVGIGGAAIILKH